MESLITFWHDIFLMSLQGMVVSLATDKAIWDAVLSNEKIKEFRRNFSAPNSEGTSNIAICVPYVSQFLSFNHFVSLLLLVDCELFMSL